MNEADKKRSAMITIRPLTSLQRLMISSEFDAFIIVVIVINCIFMASDSPVLEQQARYSVGANYCFNVIFILELSLQILAFGIFPYFADYWHWLDTVVVATSILDIIVAILAAIKTTTGGVNIDVKVLRVLRVLRFLKVLRPLKALRFFKGVLVFIESLSLSSSILCITTFMFLLAMVAIAFITSGTIGEAMMYRCIPPFEMINGVQDLFKNSTGRTDPNYQTYGYAYFVSSYNLAFCKNDAACLDGFQCQRLHVPRFEVRSLQYLHVFIYAATS